MRLAILMTALVGAALVTPLRVHGEEAPAAPAATNAAPPTVKSYYKFAIHFPPGYEKDTEKRWPAVLHAHGGGYSGGPDRLINIFGKYAKDRFIIICPVNPKGGWWKADKLIQLAASCRNVHRIDPDQFFITGHSLGSMGVLQAAAGGGMFAGVVAMSGFSKFGLPAGATMLRKNNTAAWLFVGEYDTPNLDDADRMWRAFVSEGVNARYTRMPGWGHSMEWWALPRQEIFEWMLTLNKKTPTVPENMEEWLKKADDKPQLPPNAAIEPAAKTALEKMNPKDWSGIAEGKKQYPDVTFKNEKAVTFWPWYKTDAASAYDAWYAARNNPAPKQAATGAIVPAIKQVMRNWTSVSGRVMEAKLISLNGNKATLEASDGSRVAIGIDKLSEADRTYLKAVIGE